MVVSVASLAIPLKPRSASVLVSFTKSIDVSEEPHDQAETNQTDRVSAMFIACLLY